MAENKISDLKRYLSTDENPVSMQEMTEFWNSLTDAEKAEFKAADLPPRFNTEE